jgi:hypothetical protein
MKTLICSIGLAIVALANAGVVDASYTVSGTSGDYTLNFKFTNNSPVNNLDLYFLGVHSNGTITGNPLTWGNWPGYGVGNTYYELNWLLYTNSPDTIQPGESLNGFLVHSTDVTAPTSVEFFGYLYDWSGSGATLEGNSNPVFTGTAQAVPEPATLVALGVGALAMMRRRRQA